MKIFASRGMAEMIVTRVINILNWKVKRKKKFLEGRDGALVISGCQELPRLFSAGVAGPRLCPTTWGDVPLIISQEWPARKINRLQSKLLRSPGRSWSSPWNIQVPGLIAILITTGYAWQVHESCFYFVPESLIIPSDWPKRQLTLPFSRFLPNAIRVLFFCYNITFDFDCSRNGKDVKRRVMIKKE